MKVIEGDTRSVDIGSYRWYMECLGRYSCTVLCVSGARDIKSGPGPRAVCGAYSPP